MDNINDTSRQVSPTLGDTLTDSDKQHLRQATLVNQAQPQAAGTAGQSMASRGYEVANQWQHSSLRRRIQEHPVKAAGLVLLSGILIRSIFSRKN